MDQKNILMQPTLENAYNVERMRLKSYGVKKDLEPSNSEYIYDIINQNILVFLSIINDTPVSACYISDFKGELFVDYLFTLPEYQNKGLHYGKSLLQYILDNKSLVEQHFKQKFSSSSLCIGNNGVIPLYKSLGYKMKRNNYGMMSKKI